jgi:hypothetical protein
MKALFVTLFVLTSASAAFAGPKKISVTIHSAPEGTQVFANDTRTYMGQTPGIGGPAGESTTPTGPSDSERDSRVSTNLPSAGLLPLVSDWPAVVHDVSVERYWVFMMSQHRGRATRS